MSSKSVGDIRHVEKCTEIDTHSFPVSRPILNAQALSIETGWDPFNVYTDDTAFLLESAAAASFNTAAFTVWPSGLVAENRASNPRF